MAAYKYTYFVITGNLDSPNSSSPIGQSEAEKAYIMSEISALSCLFLTFLKAETSHKCVRVLVQGPISTEYFRTAFLDGFIRLGFHRPFQSCAILFVI